MQCLTHDQARQHRIDKDRPIAIVPIKREQSGLSRFLPGGFFGQFCVELGIPFTDDLDPPFEDVADGGLAGLDTVETRQDRAPDDAADARDVGYGLLAETTPQSQEDVPMTLTSTPSATPQPTAP